MEDKSNYPKGFVYWSTLPDSNVLGGKARASTAIRDEHGRMMPSDEQAFETWQLDPEHGRKAGKVRAATARRDSKGRFQ